VSFQIPIINSRRNAMLNRALIAVFTISALAAAGLMEGGCSKSSSTGPAGGGSGGIVTIAGKIIGQNGQGVAGVPVFVTGKPSTNTDANGNFSIASVSTPYDITVVDATNKRALIYKGLSRQDPTLTFIGSSPGTARHGTVNGKISGGTFTPNQGASDVTKVVFASTEASAGLNTAVSGIFGPLNLTWYGPTVTTGSLYALQFTTDASGLPVASGYKGYGSRAGIAVNDGSTLNNQFDTLQSVGTSQFTGTVAVPSGYILAQKSLSVRVSQTTLISLLTDVTANAAVSYYTPSIAGASLVLSVAATKSGAQTFFFKNGLGTGATGAAISIVAAPDLSLPVTGATGVDTTVTFSWTAMTGGIHLIQFTSSGNPTYLVLTSGTSATIPNLKGLGLGLPAAATYQWSVLGIGPFAGADDAAGSSGFLGVLTNQALLTSDAFLGISGARTFTTAP
jgi:hypothetical protein